MQHLMIISLVILLLSGCGTNDPEGVWQNEEFAEQKYLILKVENDIAVRKPESRTWANFKNVSENQYVNQSTFEEIHFQSPNKMEVLDRNGKQLSSFKKIVLEDIDTKVLTPKMSTSQVEKFIGEPLEKTKENQVDKWLYPNNLLLVFENNSLTKMNPNFIKDRDFSKIEIGMNRQQVSDIIGLPDTEGVLKESGSGFQKWFYDENTEIIFDKEKVTGIHLNATKNKHSDSTDPGLLTYDLMDVINDKPLGFVIEDKYTEFLSCSCQGNENGATILLKSEMSSVKIDLYEDMKYRVSNSYQISNEPQFTGSLNGIPDLKLNALRFDKGRKMIGFIRIEDNCRISSDSVSTFPCYFKGTFECIIQ